MIGPGYEAFVGRLGDKEIDFMAQKDRPIVYIRVSLIVMSEDTRKREFGNLMLIEDNYPKDVATKKRIQYLDLKDVLNQNI